jgi:hypothetical protein
VYVYIFQDLRSDDVMTRGIRPGLISVMYPGDVRRQPVTLSDLKQIDPLEVNRWVREHFVPGRFEVNIAGQFHIDNLLEQLNTALGSLPPVNFSRTIEDDDVSTGILRRVGLDPYDPSDVSLFTGSLWPDNKFRSACVLRSPTPDHAHIVERVPAADYLASVDKPVIRRMTDRMVSRMMFLGLRRDNGFCYHVDTVARHSILFPGYGHFEMEWLAGRYSVHQGSPEFREDLNVVGSSLVAREILSTEVSEDVFQEVIKSKYNPRIFFNFSDFNFVLSSSTLILSSHLTFFFLVFWARLSIRIFNASIHLMPILITGCM